MQQRWKRGYKEYRGPIFHLLFIDNSVSGGRRIAGVDGTGISF